MNYGMFSFQQGYRILDGKGFSIQIFTELYAEAGLVGFKVHARVGGAIQLDHLTKH